MSKMNYKQIDHCNARLHSLRESKVGKIPLKPEGPSENEFLREVASGRRKISASVLRNACQRKIDGSCYKDLEDFLLEITYAADNKASLVKYESSEKAFRAICKRVDAEITRISDEIVLGDQQAALGLIKAFETWKL